MANLIGSLRRALATARWYWRGVTGADAYERYVRFWQEHHPGCPLPSEKEFWEDKYRDQEHNPTSRCC